MIPEDKEDERRQVIILRPRRLAILLALFLRPAHGLLAAQFHSCWVPSLLCILVALSFASLMRGCRMVKEFTPKVENVVSAVGKDVAPVSFADGKLLFSEKLEYPYSYCGEGWQINIVPPDSDVALPAKKEAAQGLVFSANKILYWLDYEGKRTISKILLNEKQMARLASSMQESGSAQLDVDGLSSLVALCMMICIPIVSFYVFLLLFFTLTVTFLMFLVAMLLVRREARASMHNTFVLIVNCLMPPVLLSSFWYCFVPLSYDFSHIFLLAALAYLLLIFFESRRKVEE